MEIWTEKQVENLKKRQIDENLHPYTCIKGHGSLVPTREGWTCSSCDYTQNWAHASDLNGDFVNY